MNNQNEEKMTTESVESAENTVPPTDPTEILDKMFTENLVAVNQEAEASPQTDTLEPKTLIKSRNNIEQNVETVLDPFSAGKNTHRPEVLITPSAGVAETMMRVNEISKEEILNHSNSREWSEVINRSLPHTSFEGGADNIFAMKSAKWTQRINTGNVNIGPMASRAEVETGSILTGIQAINAVQRHLGIGGSFTIPLPHSGFWITLKPPIEETILELNRQIHNIKTEVGRTTYGLMLSSYSGLVLELFTRFALGSMQRNSIKDVDDLLKVISVHDINIVIWAYICTIYPNGFNHKAGCIADIQKCAHVVEDIINVRRLFYMNENAFSPEQLDHLKSFAASSMTLESVTKYRESFKKKEDKIIVLCEGTDQEIKIKLRVPSAYEYFDSTNRWINGIGTKVVESLGADSSFNERNKIITEHAAATQMRKYTHWVESIDIGGIINETESIEKTLDAMSSSISVRNEFDEKVAKYVEETCLALIGVPDYKCPNCGQYQITGEGKDPLHRSIVGIDVPMTFFTMLVQRAQYVRE